MPGSTTNLYNTAPLSRPLGKTRSYRNRLHGTIGRQASERQISVVSKPEEDCKPLDAPPESSSDEEASKKSALSSGDDDEPSPKNAKRRPIGRKVRAPQKGSHEWTRLEPIEKEKEEAKDDLISSQRPRKKARTYGGSRNVNKSVPKPPTNRSSSTSNAATAAAVKEFKLPGGMEAIERLDAESSGYSINSEKSQPRAPTFKEPPPPVGTRKDAPKFIVPGLGPRMDSPEKPNISRETRNHRVSNPVKSNSSPTKPAPPKWIPPLELAKKLDSSLSSKLEEFIVPAAPPLSTTNSSPLSSVPGSPSCSAHSFDLDPASSMTTTGQQPPSPPSSTTVITLESDKCPMCDAPIDSVLLSDFISTHLPVTISRTKRLTVRQQNLFCSYHKYLDAKRLWTERAYPNIDWPTLSSRLPTFEPEIRAVIADNMPSFYRERIRNLHAKQRSKGGRQTVARELDTEGDGAELLGYYGGKGGRIVGEWFMRDFSDDLDALVESDRDLARCGGLGGFVHGVLVPEVVQRLVMQDLSVNGTRAREIMEESSGLGRLLCEEEEDEVLSEDERLG